MSNERIFLADEAATADLGARLAETLRPGDVMLLEGGLGAGKTALARAIIRNLMNEPLLEVPSPSFALVQPYRSGGRAIIHADLYRLADAREIEELGLFDDAGAVVLVEWPERAPGLRARAAVQVSLDIPAEGVGRMAEILR
jgi:tRNA threonylcarbamoyladenosine biosynthesis protein TsaE